MNKLRIEQIKRIATENLAAKAADCTDICIIRNEVAKFGSPTIRQIREIRS